MREQPTKNMNRRVMSEPKMNKKPRHQFKEAVTLGVKKQQDHQANQ